MYEQSIDALTLGLRGMFFAYQQTPLDDNK
jgi:hypothetical protein